MSSVFDHIVVKWNFTLTESYREIVIFRNTFLKGGIFTFEFSVVFLSKLNILSSNKRSNRVVLLFNINTKSKLFERKIICSLQVLTKLPVVIFRRKFSKRQIQDGNEIVEFSRYVVN